MGFPSWLSRLFWAIWMSCNIWLPTVPISTPLPRTARVTTPSPGRSPVDTLPSFTWLLDHGADANYRYAGNYSPLLTAAAATDAWISPSYFWLAAPIRKPLPVTGNPPCPWQ